MRAKIARRGAKMSPRGAKMAMISQLDAKLEESCGQEAPRSTQESLKRDPRGPKRHFRRFNRQPREPKRLGDCGFGPSCDHLGAVLAALGNSGLGTLSFTVAWGLGSCETNGFTVVLRASCDHLGAVLASLGVLLAALVSLLAAVKSFLATLGVLLAALGGSGLGTLSSAMV